jgi:hypothetical protein
MQQSRLDVSIEELVLEGVSGDQSGAVVEAARAELARLAAGVPARRASPAGDPGPEALGRQVAAVVYRRVGQ